MLAQANKAGKMPMLMRAIVRQPDPNSATQGSGFSDSCKAIRSVEGPSTSVIVYLMS